MNDSNIITTEYSIRYIVRTNAAAKEISKAYLELPCSIHPYFKKDGCDVVC